MAIAVFALTIIEFACSWPWGNIAIFIFWSYIVSTRPIQAIYMSSWSFYPHWNYSVITRRYCLSPPDHALGWLAFFHPPNVWQLVKSASCPEGIPHHFCATTTIHNTYYFRKLHRIFARMLHRITALNHRDLALVWPFGLRLHYSCSLHGRCVGALWFASDDRVQERQNIMFAIVAYSTQMPTLYNLGVTRAMDAKSLPSFKS